ncbi:MAG: monofunctional biosynthetic peptidoglycan transglycosylase [candidate division NC10 bacterium]
MRRPLAATAATFAALLVGWGLFEWWSLPDVRGLATAPPARTALVRLRAAEAAARGRTPLRQQVWVHLAAISPHLKHAVVVAEDAGFYGHGGVDFPELREAILRDLKAGRLLRGGSTLTMQLARTLYLSPRKTPLRKLREILIAWRLEAALSKDRILELYLNLVEWGDGIYGAEATARHYFGKGATDLTPEEAAALAARLPSPRRMRSQALAWRTRVVLDRMRRFGFLPVGAGVPEPRAQSGSAEPAQEDWEKSGEEEGDREGEP